MRDPFAQVQFDHTDRLRADAEIAENARRYKENEMKPTSNLVNPNLPTVAGTVVMDGVHPLLRFLAKVKKGIPSALRYGNRTQAEAKQRALLQKDVHLQEHSTAVVAVGSRFLVTIFPAEYDFDQKSGKLIAKDQNQCDARIGSPSGKHCGRPVVPGTGFCLAHSVGNGVRRHMERRSRPPFATVSGKRFNPRNRHNQNGAGPVYCQQGPVVTQLEPTARTPPLVSASRRLLSLVAVAQKGRSR